MEHYEFEVRVNGQFLDFGDLDGAGCLRECRLTAADDGFVIRGVIVADDSNQAHYTLREFFPAWHSVEIFDDICDYRTAADAAWLDGRV